MGPFVPELISDQLNLIVALLLGIGFGIVLEQAGFSSTRKLAGVFYGYDFTVLRVFFTAAVTAMSGVLLLGYFGLLDTEAIYVNPTWLLPAIVGGVIMGVGFILGGYCPGTSICAVAIGKIDAMFFVGGGIVGVFLFGELYPLYQKFYDSTALGSIKVFDSIGISQGLFALILIVVAIGAFAATTIIERRTNKTGAPSLEFKGKRHVLIGVAVIALGVTFAFLPDRKTHLIQKVSDEGYAAQHELKQMTVDELAFLIVNEEPNFRIIDVRSAAEFGKRALPKSDNVQLRDLFKKEWNVALSQRHVKKVIVGNDERQERVAGLLLRELGHENVVVLAGGLPSFEQTIFDSLHVVATGSRWDADVNAFHAQARSEIGRMIVENKNKPVKAAKSEKKIKGGC